MNADESPGKTVYLLGAGASRASRFELPTMRGFFGTEALPAGLDQFLRDFYRHEDAAEYNLEQVLSHLYLDEQRRDRWGSEGSDHVRYSSLLQYVESRLKIPLNDPPCEFHAKLVRGLRRADTVLTLNYDLVMDHAFLNADPANAAYKSRLRQQNVILGAEAPSIFSDIPWRLDVHPELLNSGHYLKLHGSLNWRSCPTPQCANHTRVGAVDEHATDVCAECGSTLRTLIVPPLVGKSVASGGRVALIWRLAWEQLREADRIVIIGASLPHSDTDLVWLLKDTTLRRDVRFVIVNLDAEMASRIKHLLSTQLEPESCVTLEGFVDTLGP